SWRGRGGRTWSGSSCAWCWADRTRPCCARRSPACSRGWAGSAMSMQARPRVVVVGSFNVDHVWHCDSLPRPGETRAGHYRTGPGGKGFNQATASARCGVETAFVCALGDDDGPRPGAGGIHGDVHGANRPGSGPGASGARPAEFGARRAEATPGASIEPAQLESPVGSVLEAMRIARAAGVRTILSPAPANALAPRELLAVADVLTPNETEFAALLALHSSERIDPAAVAGTDDEQLHHLCRTLLPRSTVVVTLGAAGAFVSHREDKCRGDEHAFYRVPAEDAQVVDTTGAGDAFNGALAASVARGGEGGFIAHVRFASLYAARSTEQPGAAEAMPRLPRQPEV